MDAKRVVNACRLPTHGLGVAVAALLMAGIGEALDLDGAIALVLWLVLAAAAIVISTVL